MGQVYMTRRVYLATQLSQGQGLSTDVSAKLNMLFQAQSVEWAVKIINA